MDTNERPDYLELDPKLRQETGSRLGFLSRRRILKEAAYIDYLRGVDIKIFGGRMG